MLSPHRATLVFDARAGRVQVDRACASCEHADAMYMAGHAAATDREHLAARGRSLHVPVVVGRRLGNPPNPERANDASRQAQICRTSTAIRSCAALDHLQSVQIPHLERHPGLQPHWRLPNPEKGSKTTEYHALGGHLNLARSGHHEMVSPRGPGER